MGKFLTLCKYQPMLFLNKYLIISFSFFILLNAHALQIPLELQGTNLINNEVVRLKPDNSKALVVVFLSAKCPCSNSHNTELQDLASQFPGFKFVAIHSNVDEEKTLAQNYFKKVSFPFPVIHDEKAKLADQFKALKTPHAFLISHSGEILYQGGITNSKDCEKADRKFLREALTDLNDGKPIRTPEGRTLGCAISRGESHVWK
jgi:peroxiredoxin